MKERIQLENIKNRLTIQNWILLGFSKKQTVETTKQPIVFVWQLTQPNQNSFQPFSKLLKSKTTGWFDKTTGYFSLSWKNTWFKKVKSQHMVGPLKGPKEESQQNDHLRRRLWEGVAKV